MIRVLPSTPPRDIRPGDVLMRSASPTQPGDQRAATVELVARGKDEVGRSCYRVRPTKDSPVTPLRFTLYPADRLEVRRGQPE